MARYKIKIRTRDGKSELLYMQGQSENELVLQLQKEGNFVVDIREAANDDTLVKKGKYRREELLMFTRLLTTVVRANIPLVTGLDIIARQLVSPFFLTLVRDLGSSLRQGLSLSQALERYPSVFDSLFINMIRAGELTGKMGDILPNLFQYLKKSYGLRKKIIAALLYPVIIFAISLLIIVFFIFFLIPQIEDMFVSFGAQLPAITEIVLSFSKFVRGNAHWIGIVIALMVAGFIFYKRTPQGTYQLDRLSLKVPIFGELLQKIYMVRFAYTFSVLYGNKVAILDSLRIVSAAMGNRYYTKAIDAAAEEIEVGIKMEEAFASKNVFPSLVIQMISIGEASRRVDEMLREVADFYDNEVDIALETMTGVIQPVAIVFLGVFIAVTLLALFLPIFNLSGIVN